MWLLSHFADYEDTGGRGVMLVFNFAGAYNAHKKGYKGTN